MKKGNSESHEGNGTKKRKRNKKKWITEKIDITEVRERAKDGN